MRLRQKLSYRSSLIFAITLCFVGTGTFFLFRYHIQELYNKKLLERAKLAAYFYLEKDELNEHVYKIIEDRFKKISKESIRLYRSNDKTLYVKDTLNYTIATQVLDQVIKRKTMSFSIKERQAIGIYYKDNEGDFIVVASGIDYIGKQQLSALGKMLLAFCLVGLIIHYFPTHILANKTFSPFSKIIDKVNEIKPDDLSVRLDVPPGKPDEMQNLIITFNYFLDRLDNSVTMQRNFLKNASHELKTPIAVLLGEIEIALHQPRSNNEYKAFLESIKDDSIQLKAIVEGLLTLSNLETTANYQMQSLRIDEVLWSVLEKKQLEYKGVNITVDFKSAEDLEDLLSITGNKELLFIALSNIVDNAVKFSYPQPVTITADMISGKLVIGVTDKGPGIAHEDLEKIFELFYRSAQNNYIKGYGIGLYLTKQILNLHHIKLEIETKIGAGTSMRIVFP